MKRVRDQLVEDIAKKFDERDVSYPLTPSREWAFTTTRCPCKHANGWFDVVKLWPRSVRVFACTDCERIVLATDVPSQRDGPEEKP